MTPVEIFRKSFPGTDVCSDDLTVISWVLPQTRLTKLDNRKETALPSERWARAKHYGGEFSKSLMIHVTKSLKNAGIVAVAPFLTSFFTIGVSERYGLASRWSERHAAYVSGLGTFGLCDGLITPGEKRSCVVRLSHRSGFPDTPVLHGSPCLVPVLCQGYMRSLHKALPGRSTLKRGPRQKPLQGVLLWRRAVIYQEPFRH